jgi:hypothetical protein
LQAGRDLAGPKRPRVVRNSAVSEEVAAAVELADLAVR